MNTIKTALQVENLSFHYGSTPVFSDISFEVPSGTYVAIVGSNGSGKSTLARCIAGILTPVSGSILVNGEPGIVFQSPSEQIVADIAEDDTAFGPSNLGMCREQMTATVTKMLDLVSLLDRAQSATSSFSPGMKQRLAIAGILALSPSLLVFDESCSMIDPVGRALLLDFIDSLHKKGCTVIHITHDMEEALRAERVLVMNRGGIMFDGTPDELFACPQLDTWGLALPPVRDCIQSVQSVWPSFSCANDCTPEEFAQEFCKCAQLRLLASNTVSGTASDSDAKKAVVQLNNVSFSYATSGADTIERNALYNVSHTFYSGTVTAIIGKTGSGKSTFMQIAAGLLQPTSGNVEITTLKNNKMYTSGSSILPYCIQEPESALFCQFSGDDVAFGPKNQGYGGRDLVRRTAQAMDSVGLPFKTFCDRPVYEMSGGERRRLGVAGILAIESPVYFFDEPSMGLDPAGRRSLFERLRELASSGATVVFSTHRLEEAASADTVVCMVRGSIAECGTPAQVFSSDSKYKTHLPWIVETACRIYPLCGGAFPAMPADFAKVARSVDLSNKVSQPQSNSASVAQNCAQSLVNSSSVAQAHGALPSSCAECQPIRKKRMHPLAAYLVLFELLVAAAFSRTVSLSLMTIGIELILLWCSKLSFVSFCKTFVSVLPFLLFIAILQLFVYPSNSSSPIYAIFLWVKITVASVNSVYMLFLNCISMMLPLWIFTKWMTRTELMDGMTALLYPLGLLGIPVEHVGLLFMLVFRFIPLLQDELDLISIAQRSRGAFANESKSFFARVRRVLPIFVPLTVRTLRKAESMAESVAARRYGQLRNSGAKGKDAMRTPYHEYSLRSVDIVVLLVCALLIVSLAVIRQHTT